MISLEFFAHQSTFYSFVINLSIRNRPFDNNRTNEIFRAINKIDRRLIALDDSYFPNCTWLHPRNVIQFNLSTFQILNYNNSNRNLTTFDRKCFGTMVEYSTIILRKRIKIDDEFLNAWLMLVMFLTEWHEWNIHF